MARDLSDAARRRAAACLAFACVWMAAGARGQPSTRPAAALPHADNDPPAIAGRDIVRQRLPPTLVRVVRAERTTAAPAEPEQRFAWPSHDLDPIYVVVKTPDKRVSLADAVTRVYIPAIVDAVRFDDPRMTLQATSWAHERQPARLADLAASIAVREGKARRLGARASSSTLGARLIAPVPSEQADARSPRAIGMDIEQFQRAIERDDDDVPIFQVYCESRTSCRKAVPVEHVMLMASEAKEYGLHALRGGLVRHFRIVNDRPAGPAADLVAAAYKALQEQLGVPRDTAKEAPRPSDLQLILLPDGNVEDSRVALHYAWRMTLHGRNRDRSVPFRVWLDAGTRRLLKAVPLTRDVGATARVWKRDPGLGVVDVVDFEVDAADRLGYTLKLTPMSRRVDFASRAEHPHACVGQAAAPFNDCDVSVGADGDDQNGMAFADFDRPPINAAADALCWSGGNVWFQQANFFAQLHFLRKQALAHGVPPSFPASAWSPTLEDPDAGCGANKEYKFGACEAYYNALCPDYSDGGDADENRMNLAHDPTVLPHEVAHNAMDTLTGQSPAWCLHPGGCVSGEGWGELHDLADAWSDHFENTNCVGGWVAKNVGGVDASYNCTGTRGHDEGRPLPRLHELNVPFHPAVPTDHFPEHRNGNGGVYANMQIAAAALWQVREGMRSKALLPGTLQYFHGLTLALRRAGFVGPWVRYTDLAAYTYLYVLEMELIHQWATFGSPLPGSTVAAGSHITNKVLAGFAKAGIFPIPPQCLDSNGQTTDGRVCGDEVAGGEAVIDVDDMEPGDDLDEEGNLRPERDVLQRGGAVPVFHVWTGSRYVFNSSGKARPLPGVAPCDAEFRVDISRDRDFDAQDIVLATDWVAVDTNNATPESPECYKAWSPTSDEWQRLQQAFADHQPIYYRATTRRGPGGREHVSTRPASGLWTVAPPFAVISADGKGL